MGKAPFSPSTRACGVLVAFGLLKGKEWTVRARNAPVDHETAGKSPKEEDGLV